MKTKIKANKLCRSALALVFAALLALLALVPACAAEGKIRNGDFESVESNRLPKDWSYRSYLNDASVSNAVVVDDASRGKVVKLTNKSDDDAHLFQTVAVLPSTVYRVSCYIKTENVVGGAGANIALEDHTCHSTPVLGTNDWQLVELIGRTGEGQTSLELGCRLGNYSSVSTGTAYFDGFAVEKLENSSSLNVVSFASVTGNSSANAAKENPKEKGNIEQYTARVKTGVMTAIAYLVVPLAICIILYYEHRLDKRRGEDAIKTPAQLEPSILNTTPALKGRTDTRLHYTRLDWIFVVALTALYAVIAVLNLGSTKFPDSVWRGTAGKTVTFDFGETVTIRQIWQNSGITGGLNGSTTYRLIADDESEISCTQEYGIMFRWNKLTLSNGSITTRYLDLTVDKGNAWFNEIAFFGAESKLLPVKTLSENDAALVDEQDRVPDYPNYMVGMYFDELYHARTAYEHINNLKVYEITHPPLGKILISLGIRAFGMNPLGWRIVGALFGVLMVPLMYAFGKRMFKRSSLALLAAALLAFDFMHFTQTRISTIDVYGVFFNLCMTYYMYKFIKMDLGDSLKDTLVPLGLSGLFFGIGIASKWICVYTGAALAVMFFTKMIVLALKAKRIRSAELTEEEQSSPAAVNARKYTSRFVKTCLACVLFFVVIPGIIYVASYYPYYTAEWRPSAESTKIERMRSAGELPAGTRPEGSVLTLGEKLKAYKDGVIKNQEYMYNYHSGLDSTHAYQSAWYEWPLSNRPIWFYAGYHHPDSSLYGTINSFGNPAVWWVCFAGTLFLAIMTLRGRFKLNADIFFILVCMGSSMLPWMLVSRCVFIYHYFATVPLIILSSVYVLKHYEDKLYYIPKERGLELSGGQKAFPRLKYVWIALAVVLFVVFYPVLSGIPVQKSYIEALQWLPTWTFMGRWPSIWP